MDYHISLLAWASFSYSAAAMVLRLAMDFTTLFSVEIMGMSM